MRLTHKARPPREPKPVEVSPEYQAEVDRSTAKLQRAYEKAQKRLSTASERYDRIREVQRRGREVDAALIEWHRRQEELWELERLMTQSPAGAAHRGRESWTKVPR